MILRQSPWLVRLAGTQRRIRLYCFCYAGGSAANYSDWQEKIDSSIEIVAVELPGRGRRFSEAPPGSLDTVVETVAQLIANECTMPFAFFGHSLGALLAFEVARYLQQHTACAPEKLLVSGAAAPQHRRELKLHLLDDEALINELRNYNGTPPAVLEHRELMDLLLPMLRADFSMAGNYKYSTRKVLNLPITVLMGLGDENAEGECVDGWRKESTGQFRIVWFEGDHFYIHQQRSAVLECIQSELCMLTV